MQPKCFWGQGLENQFAYLEKSYGKGGTITLIES